MGRFKEFIQNEIVANPPQQKQGMSWIDKAQAAGDVAGAAGDVAWGAGAPIDAANALVSAGRMGKAALGGRWADARGHAFDTAARGVSVIPGVGDAVGKSALAAKMVAKHGPEAAKAAKAWKGAKAGLKPMIAQSRQQRGQQGTQALNLPPEALAAMQQQQ